MKIAFRSVLAVVGVLMAGQASASVISPVASGIAANTYATPYMTYTTADQINTSRTSSYTGVGTLFVSFVSTATTGLGGVCTGSLVGGGNVLTAAHCLGSSADPVTSIRFYMPSFGDRNQPGAQVFNATGYAVHQNYATTGLAGGNDMALFTIAGDTSAYENYGLYLGDPLQEFTVVGTGTIGGPRGTGFGDSGTISPDYRRRVGTNIYEYYGDDVFTDSSAGVVLYDFDDGTAAHDVFGRAGGASQRGILGESSSSPGDSGGPSFINGQIAAVTSFGITGGIFQGFCGGTSSDPYNRNGTTAVTTNLSNCTNSSIGEIGGNTLVSYNIDFIRGYLNGTVQQAGFVPEPATWTMMILGFGAMGAAMRHRRRQSKFSVTFA